MAFFCFECNAPARHKHHVVPRSKGGKRTLPLCEPCHSKVHSHSMMNISELTKAGIERARAKGKTIGRPRLHCHESVLSLYAEGMKTVNIAKKIGCSSRTVLYILKKANRSD